MDDSGIFENFLDQNNMEALSIKMEPQSPPLYTHNSNSNSNMNSINNNGNNNNGIVQGFPTTNNGIQQQFINQPQHNIDNNNNGVSGISQLINNSLRTHGGTTTTTNTTTTTTTSNNSNNSNNNNNGGGLGLPSMLGLVPTQQILSSIPTPTDIHNSAAENIQQLIQHSAFNPNSLYYYSTPSTNQNQTSSSLVSTPGVSNTTSIMESMPTSPSQSCDTTTGAPSMMINSVHHQLINHHLQQQQQQHHYQIKQEQEQLQQQHLNTIIPIQSISSPNTTSTNTASNNPQLNIHNLHHNYQPANQFLQNYQLLPSQQQNQPQQQQQQQQQISQQSQNRSIFIQSQHQPHNINLTTPSEIELLSPTSSTSSPNINSNTSTTSSPIVHNPNISIFHDFNINPQQQQQQQQQNQSTISTDIHSQIANSPYLTQLNPNQQNNINDLGSPLLGYNNFTTNMIPTTTTNNLLGQQQQQQQQQTTTTSTSTSTTTTSNNFIPMTQPPIMIIGELDIIIEQQPPSDVRTRTPNDRRTFNSVIRVVGDLAKNKVGGVLAQLAYANSTTERPSQFILGGNKIGVIGKDGKVAFDSLSMTEASTKHRENEFCLEYVLISDDNRIYTTPNGPFIKRSRPFYAYSNQKVLSRRRNVTLRTLSSNRGTTLGGDQMHVVGSPFIRCNSLKCIFHTPHGDVPASNIELYSESVLFFTLPPYPLPPTFNPAEGTELPVQVVITNDGRNYSNPLSFTYIYESNGQKRLRSRF